MDRATAILFSSAGVFSFFTGSSDGSTFQIHRYIFTKNLYYQLNLLIIVFLLHTIIKK